MSLFSAIGITSNTAQRWTRIITGFVSLGVLGMWSMTISDKKNAPLHFGTQSSDDNRSVPRQPILPKIEIEQSTSSDEQGKPSD